MNDKQHIRLVLEKSLVQRKEQGYDIEAIADEYRSCSDQTSADDLNRLYKQLALTELKPGYRYREPDAYDDILRERPAKPQNSAGFISDYELKDKIRGSLLGRVCGIALGRPVEHWSKEAIKNYLCGCGCYPLDHYIPSRSVVGGKLVRVRSEVLRSTREYLSFAEMDDDINYVLLALKLIEKVGIHFSTQEVGFNWLDNVPVNRLFGPERTAYVNLARFGESCGNRYARLDDRQTWRVTHELNEYDEGIGALIRADVYGYIAPGMPQLAASMAYRDSTLTHVKNGVYGSMFVSALLAASFFAYSVQAAIEAGLAEIPQNCRLSEAIFDTIDWHQESGDWLYGYEKIAAKYNGYGSAHTINNTAILVNGLLYGNGDLEKTLCSTVMQGQDTDCTAATAGSVVGILTGAARLPDKWTAPLHNTMQSSVVEESTNQIADVADRIFNIARVLAKQLNKSEYRFNEPV